jgi:hypothetical protein
MRGVVAYLKYAGIDCSCPNCANKPGFDYPRCEIFVRWSNQHGAKITIFCEYCRCYVDVENVRGKITYGKIKRLEKPMYGWKGKEWLIERKAKLEHLKSIMAISYPGNQEIQDKYDWELDIIEKHLAED